MNDSQAFMTMYAEAQREIIALKADRFALLDALENLANVFHSGRAAAAQPESVGYVRSVVKAAEAVIAQMEGGSA